MQIPKRRILRFTTCNENRVPSGSQSVGPNGFPQSALDTVPDNGISQPLADHKSEPAVIKAIGQKTNNQQPIGGAGSLAVYLGMPF